MKRLLVSLLSAIAVSHAYASAQEKSGVESAVVDEIFAPFSGERPGCSVGVFRNGETVSLRNYGLADLATKAPLTADTVLYMASVSKQFTSLAAAKLIEDGRLGLDDDVRKWLPELPRYERPVTVRELMNHTSGVREVLGLFLLAGTQSYETLMPPEVLRMMVRQKSLNFTPGAQYAYSNGGYFLLAQLVERASGERFDEFTRKRILDPLGMKSSYFRHGSNPPGVNLAHGYVRDGSGSYQVRDTYPSFSGSGGLMSTVNDMARYDHDFHVGHKIWTEKTRQIMLALGVLANGKPSDAGNGLSYASGLRVGTLRGQPIVEHSGGHAAFTSNYVTFPKLRASVVSICNIADNPGAYNLRVIEALYPKAFSEPLPKSEDRVKPTVDRQPIPAATLTALGVGTALYRSEEIDADYRFVRDGDNLAIELFSNFLSGERPEGFSGISLDSPDVLRTAFGKLRLERSADKITITGFVLEADRLGGGIKFTRVAP